MIPDTIHNTMFEEQYDEWCDEANPRTVTYDDVMNAYKNISGTVVRTPCIQTIFSEKYEMDLYFKGEFLQCTGNFKERGVCNVLNSLTEKQKSAGVVCASSGNHGIAIAYHTKRACIPSYVVMPNNVSPNKLSRCKAYIGDRAFLKGNNIIESKNYGLMMAKKKNMLYINGYDHPHVIAGQGTCGIEILEQVPDVDAILVPVGGGGLISGVAIAVKHLKPQVEVYGVSTNKCYALAESLRKNARVTITIENNTVADGLAVGRIGVNSFHNLKNNIDKMIIVNEEYVMHAILACMESEKIVLEGAGATPLAVIMAGLVPQLKGKKVVCIATGGNIDNKLLARVIERSLGDFRRLVQFMVVLPDQVGELAKLSRNLAALKITMRDCTVTRHWVKADVYTMEVEIVAETSDLRHEKQLENMIKENYKEYSFNENSRSSSVCHPLCTS